MKRTDYIYYYHTASLHTDSNKDRILCNEYIKSLSPLASSVDTKAGGNITDFPHSSTLFFKAVVDVNRQHGISYTDHSFPAWKEWGSDCGEMYKISELATPAVVAKFNELCEKYLADTRKYDLAAAEREYSLHDAQMRWPGRD